MHQSYDDNPGGRGYVDPNGPECAPRPLRPSAVDAENGGPGDPPEAGPTLCDCETPADCRYHRKGAQFHYCKQLLKWPDGSMAAPANVKIDAAALQKENADKAAREATRRPQLRRQQSARVPGPAATPPAFDMTGRPSPIGWPRTWPASTALATIATIGAAAALTLALSGSAPAFIALLGGLAVLAAIALGGLALFGRLAGRKPRPHVAPEFDPPLAGYVSTVPGRPHRLADITFMVTTFRRPRHCRNCVDSILHHYPAAKIIVGDNGNRRPKLPDGVTYYKLPFNIGLSATRNFLVSKIDTPFFCMLDDDAVMVDPIVGDLLDVLLYDPEIGVASCKTIDLETKKPNSWCCDLYPGVDRLRVEPATRPFRATPRGTPYRPCAMVHNTCALFRTEVARGNPWRDELKLQEHIPFYLDLQTQGRWHAAYLPHIRIAEDRRRDKAYTDFRLDSKRWENHNAFLAAYGYTKKTHIPRHVLWYNETRAGRRPSVLILGCDHTGSTIAATMLETLGWHNPNADARYRENTIARGLNIDQLRSGRFDLTAAQEIVSARGPWILKDPRFVYTLHLWLPAFAAAERQPFLVLLEKPALEIALSFQKRGEWKGRELPTAEDRLKRAREQFERWPWPQKMVLNYHDLQAAVGLFDVARSPRTAAPTTLCGRLDYRAKETQRRQLGG